MPAATRDALEDLLLFYSDAGIDAVLVEDAVDRFAASREEETRRAEREGARVKAAEASRMPEPPPAPRVAAAPGPARSAPAAAPPRVVTPSADAVMAARQAAGSADTLESLRDILAGFEGCNLRFTATNLVFGDGNPAARVMFVGEAPGMDEDLQGVPFVGRSGQILDKMLAAIGLDRTGAYIANVIPWRPPGNRKPTPQETEICRPFIERQIRLVDPDVLVLLGDAAAKQLFSTSTGITRLRGQWRAYDTGAREIRAMATFHPAYLLRTPAQKRLAWRDLLALKAELAGR